VDVASLQQLARLNPDQALGNFQIKFLKDVLDEVDGDDGGQVPVQLGQDQHLALQNLLSE